MPTPDSVAQALYQHWEQNLNCPVAHPGSCGDACMVARIARREREIWEEAAKVADDWPADCLNDPEENCGPAIAEEFRLRARLVTP